MCLKDEKHWIFVFRNMYCWHPPAWNTTVFYSWLMSSRDFRVGLWGSHHSTDSATQTNSLGFSFGLCWLSLDWWIPTCVFRIWSESKLHLLFSFREALAIRQHSVITPSNRDTVEMCCYQFDKCRPPTPNNILLLLLVGRILLLRPSCALIPQKHMLCYYCIASLEVTVSHLLHSEHTLCLCVYARESNVEPCQRQISVTSWVRQFLLYSILSYSLALLFKKGGKSIVFCTL